MLYDCKREKISNQHHLLVDGICRIEINEKFKSLKALFS